jgi:hypothetical protein
MTFDLILNLEIIVSSAAFTKDLIILSLVAEQITKKSVKITTSRISINTISSAFFSSKALTSSRA